MSELLPCPICGHDAELVEGWYVYCPNRSCWVDGTALEDTEAEAIAAWNSRAKSVFVTGTTIATDGEPVTYAPMRTCRNTHENRWFKCSACGFGFTDLYLDDESDIDEQPRYCLNCGAKVIA